jgi:hypothetical protein
MSDYQIGDMVRLVQISPILIRDDPLAREDRAFFELCLGKVFRVEGYDDHGQLELWATDKGNWRKASRGGMHTIWIEPECVQPAS